MRVVRTQQLHCSGKQAIYSERKRDTVFLKIQSFCMSEFGRWQSSQCNWPNWLIEKKFLRLWKKREKYKRENYMLIYNGQSYGISGKQKNIKMHTLKSYYLPFVDNLLLMQTASRDVGEIAGSGLMIFFFAY